MSFVFPKYKVDLVTGIPKQVGSEDDAVPGASNMDASGKLSRSFKSFKAVVYNRPTSKDSPNWIARINADFS